jgi:two-component system, sensor histidine kinase YesM
MLEWFAKKVARLLPKTKIARNLFVGYLLIILFPILMFAYFLYHQAHMRFVEQYLLNRQELIEQANSNLKVDLTQFESVYQLFQNNQYVLEYLSSAYENELQYVYNLVKYIRPSYSYVYAGNSQIESIRMYSTNPDVYALVPEFGRMNDFIDNHPEHKKVMDLAPGRGIWLYKQAQQNALPVLSYYQKIYDAQFSKQIGIMELKITNRAISNLIAKVKTKPDDSVVVLSNYNKLLFTDIEETGRLNAIRQSAEKAIAETKSKSFYLRDVDLLGNMIDVEPLAIKVISFTSERDVNIQRELQWLAWGGITCLVVLSIIYYWIVASLTRRILKLARHMRNVDSNNLSKYEDNSNDRDEISFLADSYNAMLQRIDDLVNTVHRVELMRKEADYKVMQAQIRPHFLYNTLESIRMLAEVKGAPEVADFTHIFGKLIRYSLSSDKSETTLRHELEHVRNFLVIHKNRVGERLHYEIDVSAQINRFICPRFILQPLVENSIVHGLSKLRKQWVLRIRVFETESFIKVEITDNGLGIEENRLRMIQEILEGKQDLKRFQTDSGGLGVYNVHERIKHYYGNDSGLTLTSRYQQGTTCVIQMYKGDWK